MISIRSAIVDYISWKLKQFQHFSKIWKREEVKLVEMDAIKAELNKGEDIKKGLKPATTVVKQASLAEQVKGESTS